MRAFFRRHPTIHNVIHWLAFVLGGAMELQAQILGASALFPEGSALPHYIAYALGTIAFTNVFVGKADKALDPAAPVVPASEADTKVERPDPEKSK